MSGVILPLGAPRAYSIALSQAWDQYSIGDRTPDEQATFVVGFQKGWEAAKNNTIQILERLNEEPKNE